MNAGSIGIARDVSDAKRSHRGFTARAFATVLALASAAPALFAGCGGKPQVSVEVGLPESVSAEAAWIEIGAFSGKCPEPAQLGGGLPAVGALTRAAFRIGSSPTPALGDVPKGSYAFIAVAKREDCGVVATGCSAVDVSDSRSISIALSPTDAPTGACVDGTVCQNARCVPGLDNADPSVGAGCSLQLIGAGPLANPLPNGNVSVSAPALAATPTGFLIAYREYDAVQGSARLALIPIDSGGGALAPVFETLRDRCTTSEESDATGMAFNGDSGLVVVSRADCGTSATGLNLFNIDTAGTIARRGVIGIPAVRSVTLATAHALAPIPGSPEYFLAALRDDRTSVSQTNDVAEPTGAADFGGAPPMTAGWVASSDKVFALLASATGSATPTTPDAGDDAAGEGGPRPGPTGGATLRLQIAAAGSSLAALPSPVEFEGTWGSIAAQSTRVVVASDGAGIGRPVALRIFDLGRPSPQIDGYAPEGLGKVLYADVALRQDHMFLAVEQPGAISLVAFERAATTPALLREVSLARDPRIPSIANVRDGRIAVAASDTRVGVAWTTAQKLVTNDVVGGYAIFACRTP